WRRARLEQLAWAGDRQDRCRRQEARELGIGRHRAVREAAAEAVSGDLAVVAALRGGWGGGAERGVGPDPREALAGRVRRVARRTRREPRLTRAVGEARARV